VDRVRVRTPGPIGHPLKTLSSLAGRVTSKTVIFVPVMFLRKGSRTTRGLHFGKRSQEHAPERNAAWLSKPRPMPEPRQLPTTAWRRTPALAYHRVEKDPAGLAPAWEEAQPSASSPSSMQRTKTT